jgi:capsular polysaccharide transport system permease protein
MSEHYPAARKERTSAVLDGTERTVHSVHSKTHLRPLTRFYQRAVSLAPGRRLTQRAVPIDVFSPEARTSSFPFGKLSFIACVLIPALAVSLYFAFIASDQFVAEARFVVRLGPQDSSAKDGLSSVLSAVKGGVAGSAGTGASEDAHVVTSYVQSRAIVDDVQKNVDLRAIFTRPEADYYARLKSNASIEELVEYWRGMVGTYIDSMSGIVTVQVRAFRPDDAVLIVKTIGELSEKLVNDISRRARQDALRRATEEVERAQSLVYGAIRELEAFRNAEGLIDPVQTATETGRLLTKVLAEQIAAQGELFVANRSLAPDSPAIRRLTSRIEALRQQTADLRAQLAGNRDETRNVAASLARFEEVAIKQKMAETLYSLAEAGLDRARRQAEAQSVYLSVFVQPGLPQEYSYPKRFEYSIAIAIALFVLWSIAALIWLSIEDHRLG